MKRICLLFLLIPMLTSIPLRAQGHHHPESSSIPGHVVAAFTGGSVGNTCVWYFPVLGHLKLSDLFDTDPNGSPIMDKEHARFIWVSDWTIEAYGVNSEFGPPVTMAVIPADKATIYYSENPTLRDWSDLSKRDSWGVPVATFHRGAGLFHSPDGFKSTDTFYFSAPLLTSRDINLGGKVFNFRYLIPYGMTCFENGNGPLSATETGTCLAMGN